MSTRKSVHHGYDIVQLEHGGGQLHRLPEDLQTIVAKGAVADVCLRYFDAAGRPVGTSLDGRVLGIELPAFLAIPRRVAVAGGPEKVPAIRGALAGRLINVLVSDEDTARALLEG